MFRGDYSHYQWYEQINRIHAHPEIGVLSFPFVLSYGLSRIRERSGMVQYVPFDMPRKEWLDHGRDIKTAPSFRRNLTHIIELAQRKSEPLVLMTFAFYVPEGNWPKRFEVQRSEWGVRRTKVAVWGAVRDQAVDAFVGERTSVETRYEMPDALPKLRVAGSSPVSRSRNQLLTLAEARLLLPAEGHQNGDADDDFAPRDESFLG